MRQAPADGAPRRRIGLVANLSGIFGKQAVALFSNEPNPRGYGYADVTAEVAQHDLPLPLADDYAGPATVVGYTVVFEQGRASHGVAICDTPGGARTVARFDQTIVFTDLASMKAEPWSADLRKAITEFARLDA